MSTELGPLNIVSGKPFNQTIRIPNTQAIWATVDELEIRAQLRVDKFTTSSLISNLHDFMTKVYDDADLVITWSMSGAKTRELYAKKWGLGKNGYVNVIVSDLGIQDSRALVLPLIKVHIDDTTTTAGGDA